MRSLKRERKCEMCSILHVRNISMWHMSAMHDYTVSYFGFGALLIIIWKFSIFSLFMRPRGDWIGIVFLCFSVFLFFISPFKPFFCSSDTSENKSHYYQQTQTQIPVFTDRMQRLLKGTAGIAVYPGHSTHQHNVMAIGFAYFRFSLE